MGSKRLGICAASSDTVVEVNADTVEPEAHCGELAHRDRLASALAGDQAQRLRLRQTVERHLHRAERLERWGIVGCVTAGLIILFYGLSLLLTVSG